MSRVGHGAVAQNAARRRSPRSRPRRGPRSPGPRRRLWRAPRQTPGVSSCTVSHLLEGVDFLHFGPAHRRHHHHARLGQAGPPGSSALLLVAQAAHQLAAQARVTWTGSSTRFWSLTMLMETGSNSRRNVEQQVGRPQGPMPGKILAWSRAPTWCIWTRVCRTPADLAHQFAEVHAPVGGEVERHLRAVEGPLGLDQLHGQRRARRSCSWQTRNASACRRSLRSRRSKSSGVARRSTRPQRRRGLGLRHGARAVLRPSRSRCPCGGLDDDRVVRRSSSAPGSKG